MKPVSLGTLHELIQEPLFCNNYNFQVAYCFLKNSVKTFTSCIIEVLAMLLNVNITVKYDCMVW